MAVSAPYDDRRGVPQAICSVRGAVPALPRGHRRRHHPRQPQLRAVSDLHRARRGQPQVGRRRQRADRPLDGPRLAAARPQPSAGHRGGRRADPQGHPLRRVPRARGRLGRADRAPDPQRGMGALHDERHRGDDAGHARRAGVYGPRADHSLRRALPRLARLRHGWLPAAVRHADLDGRAEGGGRDDAGGVPEQHRVGDAAAGRAPGPGRGGHPRAGRRLERHHSDQRRVPARAARADGRARRRVDLRRGDHRASATARAERSSCTASRRT